MIDCTATKLPNMAVAHAMSPLDIRHDNPARATTATPFRTHT